MAHSWRVVAGAPLFITRGAFLTPSGRLALLWRNVGTLCRSTGLFVPFCVASSGAPATWKTDKPEATGYRVVVT